MKHDTQVKLDFLACPKKFNAEKPSKICEFERSFVPHFSNILINNSCFRLYVSLLCSATFS